MKLHVIMSMFVFITVIVGGMLMFYDKGVETYTPSDYNNGLLSNISGQLDELNSIANETAEAVRNIKSDNPLDLIGALFNSGYSAVLTAFTSVSTGLQLMTSAITGLPMGNFTNTLITGLTAVFLIYIFIGIGIHIITKSDRT